MGYVKRGKRDVPEHLASFDAAHWRGLVMASEWPAERHAYLVGNRATNEKQIVETIQWGLAGEAAPGRSNARRC